jgi:DNA-binding NarL/FixJ family response regulator
LRNHLLAKDRLTSHHEIGLAIRQLVRGGSYLDPAVVTPFLRDDAPGVLRLTPWERRILGDVAGGASNGAIAARRGISKRTVERRSARCSPSCSSPMTLASTAA